MESISKTDEKWIKMMNIGHRMGCHQMPERSFFLGDYQFPVCARCTGVIIGEIAAVIGIIAGIRMKWHSIIISLSAMGIDWGLQFAEIKQSTNRRRLFTGILGGLALTYVYFYAIRNIIKVLLCKFIHAKH